MDNKYPIPGSRWRHHSGKVYTVIYIANTGNNNPDYPISVVYIGRNGDVWVKPIDNFLTKMSLRDWNFKSKGTKNG